MPLTPLMPRKPRPQRRLVQRPSITIDQVPLDWCISCFLHKIRSASAGWTRAVAIFDDET